MPHTKVMCFFKKDIREKTPDCSHEESGSGLSKTSFSLANQFHKGDNYYLGLNARQKLAKKKNPKNCDDASVSIFFILFFAKSDCVPLSLFACVCVDAKS